ncbi:MAG: hypothetical protein IKX18_06250 [Muribaculaceae bacterium]|nr:hypothetical protein [Muribaculaceae bacterium]
MKKLFTLIAALLMLSASAETLTLYGDAGEYLAAVPFNGNWVDEVGNKTQVLYPAADLTAMVGKQITAITFYSEPEGSALDGGLLDISLGETTLSVMSDAYITDGMTKVGTCTFTACENEVYVLTITFDTPYTYNGGNLVFENVVVQSTSTSFTYWTGMKTNYNNAVVGGMNGSASARQFLPKTTFTYEGGEEPGNTVATLNEANALEDAAEFTFGGDAVVTVFKNGYLFLRDESGYGMIAGVTGDFENGQVLNQGWNAAKTSVNDGWVRYINAEGLSASGETNDDLAAAQVLTEFPNESMLNAYVVIENQEHSGSGGFGPGLPGHSTEKFTLPNGDKIQKTETLWGIDADANTENYNVYGVIVKVNGTLMINPVATELYVAPEPEGLRGDVNDDKKVDITDATMLINYLLSNDPTGINMANANCDLSEDGKVDITDATTLINYLLNNAW